MKKFLIFMVSISLLGAFSVVKANSTDQTAKHYEEIKNDPQQLLVFLQSMPKGADLHNHLGGAGMAENMIQYAEHDDFCLDKNTLSVENGKCAPKNSLASSLENQSLYNSLIDAWSMRNFHPVHESGHDHFFATFGKYYLISAQHSGEILAEIVDRAGSQNELYLELMVTPDNDASGMLGKKLGWNADLTKLREKLLANGLPAIVSDISKNIDHDEAVLNKTLLCKTDSASPGCGVKVRYLYQVLREQAPEQVFGQLLAGFEVASKDPRFVGINMVQPEDGIISMRDYKLHMRMVGFLHQLYPNVHISLHAGELNSDLVSTDGLRSHIHDAVEVAHAERIGHGVDIAYEDNADKLLKEMAAKKIMVEINLTSNAEILGISGKNHPLPLYLKYHVPVALSTDDEGVLRTTLTQQYVQAITTYHFSYPLIKDLVRNSLTFSFLPGKNLWKEDGYHQVITACEHDTLGAAKPSTNCQIFLSANEKAAMQWQLEKRFNEFEKNN
jgi:adenosine deaminase